MTDYKKEEPQKHPDWDKWHKDISPLTIEHYLFDIIECAKEIIHDDDSKCPTQNLAYNIINYARKAWDLVPEETICVKCNKELAMNHPSKLCCGCYNEK